MRTLSYMVSIAIALTVIFGCSNRLSPILPDEPSRAGMTFNDPWTLWQGANQYVTYKNIDLSVCVDEDDEPAEIDNAQWTIATTIKRDIEFTPLPIASIEYAWLDDQTSPNGGAAGPQGTAFTANYGASEEIAAVKVAAIRPYSVLAAVSYMSRNSTSTDWDIHAFTMEWDPSDFPAEEPTNITSVVNLSDHYSSGNDNETDDWSPDLAWDPATGLVHVVWTGHTGEDPHPYRVMCSRWDGDQNFSPPEAVYEDGYDYAEWAPRIAIGSGIEGSPDIVGIVFSAYQDTEEGWPRICERWHVGAAWWQVEYEGPEDAQFIYFEYLSDTGDAAGYPRLDLAPRGSDDHYGSIVFTQHDNSADTYKTIEINNVRDDFWEVEGIEPTPDEEFNGAVAIHYSTQDPTASISHFEFDGEDWIVTAARYELLDEDTLCGWVPIDEGIDGGALAKWGDFIDFLEIETFQTSDIVTIGSGNADNAYWLGYCDSIDSGATKVYVAYGNTYQ